MYNHINYSGIFIQQYVYLWFYDKMKIISAIFMHTRKFHSCMTLKDFRIQTEAQQYKSPMYSHLKRVIIHSCTYTYLHIKNPNAVIFFRISDTLEKSGSASDKEMESKNGKEQQRQVGQTTQSDLLFLDLPKGDDMRIHDLRLQDEYLLFEAFSDLMGYLQPSGSLSGNKRFIKDDYYHNEIIGPI